jgi:hypothetical protein
MTMIILSYCNAVNLTYRFYYIYKESLFGVK